MIRTIGTRIIIPKGDTGSFTLPIKKENLLDSDIAIFSVKDYLTSTTVIEKNINIVENQVLVHIEHEDTAKLAAGKYFWDIKVYHRPDYDEEGNIVDALEIDSYYSAFEQPQLIIKEVAKNHV